MRATLTLAVALVMAASAASAAAQQPAAPPAAPPAAAPAPAAGTAAARAAAQRRAQAARDSSDSTAIRIDYRREVYNYQGAARDPFASLITEAATQTSINDLRLVSIIYDARGGRSFAVIRDRNRATPYRVRRGEVIGRLRVIQIRPYEVVFQVEEFGFERQEVLALQRPEVNR